MKRKIKRICSSILIITILFSVAGFSNLFEFSASALFEEGFEEHLYGFIKDGVIYETSEEPIPYGMYYAYVVGFEQKYDENGEPVYKNVKIADEIKAPYGVLPVKFIQFDTFMNHPEIESVTIGDNIEDIDMDAFYGCTGLKEVNFSDNLRSISSDAFHGCKSLKEIQFPDSLESIGSSAFKGCKKIKEVHFPAKVEYIGEKAFANCKKLEKIEFEDISDFQNIRIYNSAFKNTKFVNEAHKKGEPIIIYDNILLEAKAVKSKNLTISGDEIKVIAGSAFAGNKNIKKLTIDGVKGIGYKAFARSGITSAKLKNVKTIGRYAFEKCRSLKQCSIYGAKNIQWGTFKKCTALQTVTLGGSTKMIGQDCFEKCKNLKSLLIKSKKKIIWEESEFRDFITPFDGCKSLQTIKLKSSKVSNTIKKVIFPKKVTLDVPNSARSAYRKKVNCKVI